MQKHRGTGKVCNYLCVITGALAKCVICMLIVNTISIQKGMYQRRCHGTTHMYPNAQYEIATNQSEGAEFVGMGDNRKMNNGTKLILFRYNGQCTHG